MKQLLVSAAHKSSGKTTLSTGLCAALRDRGLIVQPFKKGPDYIDPMWLAQASGRACFNLDPHLMSPEDMASLFRRESADADIAVVEGNLGLFDGMQVDGSTSNAQLSRHLNLPVLLVLDTRGMTRGIAPLLQGYQAFEPGMQWAGVVLNRVGGSRHESNLRAVIEHYTDLPVVGAIAENDDLRVVERHLGLIPSEEHEHSQERIKAMAQCVAAGVDLDKLLSGLHDYAPVARPAPPKSSGDKLRVGWARDSAFAFYYPDDIQALEREGVDLLPFSPLHDVALPKDLDGLFIGGGFPETVMDKLQANVSMRTSIREAIDGGLYTYAECGGLMYLSEAIQWQGQSAKMVGVIEAQVSMHAKPVGRGYIHMEASEHMPWPIPQGQAMHAHEFHYSKLQGLPSDSQFAWRIRRGHGIDGQHDGLVLPNVLASYSHLRDLAGSGWVSAFVQHLRSRKNVTSTATNIRL